MSIHVCRIRTRGQAFGADRHWWTLVAGHQLNTIPIFPSAAKGYNVRLSGCFFIYKKQVRHMSQTLWGFHNNKQKLDSTQVKSKSRDYGAQAKLASFSREVNNESTTQGREEGNYREVIRRGQEQVDEHEVRHNDRKDMS